MPSAALPTPQRRAPVKTEAVWKIPHKVGDPLLYEFGIYHHPSRWDFRANAAEKLGEFLPAIEVLRKIPGVGGEPDPRGSPFRGSFGPTSRHAGLLAKGWIHIPDGDPRLPEAVRDVDYTLPGAGGTLHVCPWDVCEPRGAAGVTWLVDHEALDAYQRAVATIVPRLTIATYNGIVESLSTMLDRRRARAAKSEVAVAEYRATEAQLAQCRLTWAAYCEAEAPATVRIRPTKAAR